MLSVPVAHASDIPPIIYCEGRPVTSLEFSGPVGESAGADPNAPAVGDVFRYSNIAPGVDALVSLDAVFSGGSVPLFDDDTTANLPTDPAVQARLANYFQPQLRSVGTSSADFTFTFVQAGAVDTPSTRVELDLAMSSIDVDGNGNPNGDTREFVEHDDNAVGYVLNGQTNLLRNAAPPAGAPGLLGDRYEVQNFQFQPGIDPTAEDNIVTTFFTDTSQLNFRIGAFNDTNRTQTRLTSVGFDCPNLTTPVPQSSQNEDFGDASTTYGNPTHVIPGTETVRLGASITADTGPYNSPTASGDGGDDGAIVPDFLSGELKTFDVSVVNSTSRTGYLQAWIDWNRDGDFGSLTSGAVDAGEQVAINVQDTDGDGTISLTVSAPPFATAGTTIARLRWSTDIDVSFQEAADDGEVEDYQITLDTPTPFACDATLYQISDAPSALQTLSITPSGSGYAPSRSTIGTADETISAGWGYNPVDNLLYGVRNGFPRFLWRVDAAGRFSTVAQLGSGFRNGQPAGDILPGGRLVYRNNSSRWVEVGLANPSAPTDEGDFNLSTTINTSDIAYNPVDSVIYGIDQISNQLFWVDVSGGPGTKPVNFFGPTTYTAAYGSMWFDDQGNFYAYETASNAVLMIDVGSLGSGTGVASVLGAASDEGGTDDGASCRGAPPIALGALAGTLYEDADSDDAFDAGEDTLPADISLAVYDDLGTPSTSDDVLVRRAVSNASGAFLFSNLLPVRSYRLEVDTSDTDIPQTLQLGTANPLLGRTVPANGTNGGNDFGFDILTPGLDGEKSVETWDPNAAGVLNTPGSEVVYTLTIRNPGGVPTDADTIFLVDSLPPETSFWNGDLEDGGPNAIPGTDPVALVQSNGAALTFDFATDFGVSTAVAPPTDFSQCSTTTPTGQHEDAVRHLCFRPRGSLAGGNPVPEVEIKFRALVR